MKDRTKKSDLRGVSESISPTVHMVYSNELNIVENDDCIHIKIKVMKTDLPSFRQPLANRARVPRQRYARSFFF